MEIMLHLYWKEWKKIFQQAGAAPIKSEYQVNQSFLSEIQQICFQWLRQWQSHYLVSQYVHLLEDFNIANVSVFLLFHFLVLFLIVLLLLALHCLGDQLITYENVGVDASPPAAPAFALLGNSLHRPLPLTVLVGQAPERAADVDARQVLKAADSHWRWGQREMTKSFRGNALWK